MVGLWWGKGNYLGRKKIDLNYFMSLPLLPETVNLGNKTQSNWELWVQHSKNKNMKLSVMISDQFRIRLAFLGLNLRNFKFAPEEFISHIRIILFASSLLLIISLLLTLFYISHYFNLGFFAEFYNFNFTHLWLSSPSHFTFILPILSIFDSSLYLSYLYNHCVSLFFFFDFPQHSFSASNTHVAKFPLV